jgi:hypothetical protein
MLDTGEAMVSKTKGMAPAFGVLVTFALRRILTTWFCSLFLSQQPYEKHS